MVEARNISLCLGQSGMMWKCKRLLEPLLTLNESPLSGKAILKFWSQLPDIINVKSLEFPPPLADCPAMTFAFVCWHSRKWWPPIRIRTLQMLVLWPKKLNQIDSFCKSGILYAWGGPRSIERCRKHGAPPKKNSFSQAYLSFSQFVPKSCSNQSGQTI